MVTTSENDTLLKMPKTNSDKTHLLYASISKLFTSQLTELGPVKLEVLGSVPPWLLGSLVSIGPAQFEVGTTSLNHWFDGFAMLKKFEFTENQVLFQNRFLHSQQYLRSRTAGHLYYNEFATAADTSRLGRLVYPLKALMRGGYYDNCNINVTQIGHQFIAMTESSITHEFDLKNLQTIAAFQWDDSLQGQMSTAHPHLDMATREIFNVLIAIGRKNKYCIYKGAANSKIRHLIHTYESEQLFYMHSFSITPHYIILFKSPLILNKLKLMMRSPFIEAFDYLENKMSSFIIIDRRVGGSIIEIETDPFVCLHSANAHEQGSDIILDLVCYGKGNPYDYFYLAAPPTIPNTSLRRYVVDLKSRKCRHFELCEETVEFPNTNYQRVNGRNYQFLYTAAKTTKDEPYINAIQKIDVKTGKTAVWARQGIYPAEPIFVAKPLSAGGEDNGVLLTIVFDANKQLSSLILLEASSMLQIAEILLPFHLPMGLHGRFYSA